MSQKICFDAAELHRSIANSLYPVLGPATFSNNYTPILRNLSEQLLSVDKNFPRYDSYAEFASYGISEELAEQAISLLLEPLYRMFKPYFGERIGVNVFAVEIYPDGRLIVEDCGALRDDYAGVEPDLWNNFQKYIADGIDNGDWVSPRLRQLAGF
jgi:hypothetical protein